MTLPSSADVPDGDVPDPGDNPPPVTTFTPAPGITTLFNQPNLGSKYAVQTYLCQLIDNTPAGATIRIAMYEFTQQMVLASLTAAYTRGVFIHYVGDKISAGYIAYETLRALLGGDVRQSSYSVLCYYGCVGNNINHDKFFTFSQTGTVKNVCVQASANMTNIGNWNNAVVFNGYPKLYAAYVARHGAMRVGATTGQHFKTGFTSMTDGNTKVYFYPEPGNKDTVLDQLNNITKPKGAVVHVAVYQITNLDIAAKLRALKKAGAEVVVCTTIYGTTNDRALSTLGPDIPIHRFPFVTTGYLHSKYMTISGEYAGKPNSRLVFTGSLNYTYTALHNNDESVVRISNSAVYAAYEADFANLLTVFPAS